MSNMISIGDPYTRITKTFVKDTQQWQSHTVCVRPHGANICRVFHLTSSPPAVALRSGNHCQSLNGPVDGVNWALPLLFKS